MPRGAILIETGRKTVLHCSGCDAVLATFRARRRVNKIERGRPYYCRACHPDRKAHHPA